MSPEEREERLKTDDEKWKTEAAERMEAGRQQHIKDEGHDVSTDDFTRMKEAKKKKLKQEGRGSAGGGRQQMTLPHPLKTQTMTSSQSILTLNGLTSSLIQRTRKTRLSAPGGRHGSLGPGRVETRLTPEALSTTL